MSINVTQMCIRDSCCPLRGSAPKSVLQINSLRCVLDFRLYFNTRLSSLYPSVLFLRLCPFSDSRYYSSVILSLLVVAALAISLLVHSNSQC